MQLTQKEKSLLKDLKNQEKICVEKYTQYSEAAHDTQLKTLFTNLANAEQTHYDAIVTIESGEVPKMKKPSGSTPEFSATYTKESQDKKHDCYLCSDLLSTEKHASHLYDTCVFEFTTENLRDVLNQIQTEEQNHGKALYDYMKANSMYS